MELMKELLRDPKTLMYDITPTLIPSTSEEKVFTDQIFALEMDDSIYSRATIPLQKESEFLPLFNHYILKTMECGLLRRLFIKYHADLFVKENFEMVEPDPLGFNSVMFVFISLGTGMCLSIPMVMAEFMKKDGGIMK